jgi:hypothetical protein
MLRDTDRGSSESPLPFLTLDSRELMVTAVLCKEDTIKGLNLPRIY